ncbi:MAG: family 78 glycoside hydrolase catalytic domain [Lentisphaerae bacterium]|nr:family 78 glycoside hydrolase catalytic domain [Lentisphaerota bacterium]
MNKTVFPVALKCEHLVNPLGLDERAPRLSWRLEDDRPAARQTAWQVVAASSREKLEIKPDLWDSGRVAGDESLDIIWDGKRLTSRTEVFWRVRVWDLDGEVTEWSETAHFSMGLLQKRDWQAAWIGRDTPEKKSSLPSPYLRRSFTLDEGVARARLYVTARGIFECYLNGARVGGDYFAPGWTNYNKRYQVAVYDVTEALVPGDNVIGAILADGWYAGNLSKQRAIYGEQLSLLAQLEVTYTNGKRVTICSDDQWCQATGPILSGDFYDGELYDARLESEGWHTVGFDDSAWEPVTLFEPPAKATLSAWRMAAVRRQEELAVVEQSEPEFGVHVFDLGQNMVGWARIRVRAHAGRAITIRYAEMLNADGTLYTENLRSAKCIDTYICKSDQEEVWEPRFTFHGFRYVELTGLCEKPRSGDVTGVVIHTDIPPTGDFECSDELVNKLQQNIVWGQRGNYLEVPTDCPQRDERLGWTGDAQVFARTGCFNRDVAAFFNKWCLDVEDAQYHTGVVPHVVPDIFHHLNADGTPPSSIGAAAWADAVVICPWVVYLSYGDKRILEQRYNSMAAWITWRKKTSKNLIHSQARYGDWLAISPNTPRDLIATAYFAHTATIMAKIAHILGKTDHAKEYTTLAREVRAAFNKEFVTPNGRIMGDTQTAYLLALAFDLLPPSKRPAALANLLKEIEGHGWKLSTGFVGTPLLAPVLSEFGRTDVAYRLLLQREYPSWLYPILQGATTMWERWNSFTLDKGFGDAGMNSFNHYAYGAIGEWLYAVVAGIDVDAANPGYKHIIIKPQPGEGITWARGELRSRYGKIVSHWRIEDGKFHLDVTIPANTTATVTLPDGKSVKVVAGSHSFSVNWLK